MGSPRGLLQLVMTLVTAALWLSAVALALGALGGFVVRGFRLVAG